VSVLLFETLRKKRLIAHCLFLFFLSQVLKATIQSAVVIVAQIKFKTF